MHLSVAAILLAGASTAHAFADTSPFVLFSTAKCVIVNKSLGRVDERLLTREQICLSTYQH